MLEKKIKRRAGRPEGTSKYKEKTIPIRVPLTLVPHVERLLDSYIINDFKVKVINTKGTVKVICKNVPEPHL